MISESFGLVRIRYGFLKKKEYIFIYSLILVTFDGFFVSPLLLSCSTKPLPPTFYLFDDVKGGESDERGKRVMRDER